MSRSRLAAGLVLAAPLLGAGWLAACDDNEPIYGVAGGAETAEDVELEIVLGDLQKGRTSEALPEPLVVQALQPVTDVAGERPLEPVEGIEIGWSITKGVATLSNPVSFTNADGITSGCHENGPGMHPLGQPWMDKAEPGYHGNSSSDCALCHNVDVFCWECHFGEDGSRVPPGDTSEHGDEEDHRRLERYRSTCNNCHDTNRLYGHAPGGCHDCHDD